MFDFTLLLVSWIDVLLTELDTMDLELTQSVVGFLRIILRAARILKLFKVCNVCIRLCMHVLCVMCTCIVRT